MPTSLILNGKNITLNVDPNMPLLQAIRESAGLYGTKFGCGMAQCGACTVQLNGIAIRSCILPVSTVVGEYVITVEGIQSKPSKTVQGIWVKLRISQYGYCQSSQIMSAIALSKQNADPSGADIDAAVNDNICRYTAYVRIRVAIHEAVDTLKTQRYEQQNRSEQHPARLVPQLPQRRRGSRPDHRLPMERSLTHPRRGPAGHRLRAQRLPADRPGRWYHSDRQARRDGPGRLYRHRRRCRRGIRRELERGPRGERAR